jgi:hypothetical protein
MHSESVLAEDPRKKVAQNGDKNLDWLKEV